VGSGLCDPPPAVHAFDGRDEKAAQINMSSSEPAILDYSEDALRALADFLKASFPDSPLKARLDYIRWRNIANPLEGPASASVIASRGDRLCGNLSVLPDRICVGGEWKDAVWLYDLFIDEAERKTLLAARLIRTVMARNEVSLITGSTPQLERFYKALKWQHLSICRTLFWIRRPSSLLKMAAEATEATAKKRMLISALKPIDPLWKIAADRRSARAHVQQADLAVEEVSEAPEGLAEIVEACCAEGLITTQRDSSLLSWKLRDRPEGRHVILTARSLADGALRGYMAVKNMMRPGAATWAEVVDYVVKPQDSAAFHGLINGVQERARSLDLDFVRFRCSLPAHTSALRALAWIDRTRPVIDDVFAYAKKPDLRKALADGKWHLTAIVSDRADYGKDEWQGT
jgi:hypothetical protein